MSASGRYICAFRGRRDYYQVPVALAEGDMLEEFVTDAYAGNALRSLAGVLPERLSEKFRSRYEPNLPETRVKCVWGSAVSEHLRSWLGCAPSVTFAKLDRQFGSALVARTRKTESDLLIYSHYAWEPFTARYRHTPRRVLFQFHPHPATERRILLEDSAKYPFVRHAFEEETGEHVSDDFKRRSRDGWQHADLILCASSFTRQSLIEAGAEASRCKVIPYGIDVANPISESMSSEQFAVLFVGTGSQRKGLHHLLLAWKKAVLPKNSRLILVCRFIDAAMAAMANSMPNVHAIYGVGAHQLHELFSKSTLFAMPSLVEGFGQVYLEALAHGCPVLGTANTGLPDVCDNKGAIWQVEPGQVDQLVSTLEILSRMLPGDLSIRRRAQACAVNNPWKHFRAGIRSALAIA